MDPLAPLINSLHAEGRLRVWSLVITAFGDLVQHRGGVISTARLGQLMGRIGIEQGTLRTALSRLGRDGWVVSERQGRASLYRLSAQGLDRFAPATSRIYAAPRLAALDRWAMAVRIEENGAQTVTLWPDGEQPEDADCRIEGTLAHVSPRFRAALLTGPHRAALAELEADLRALKPAISKPLDAAAARLLLIHRWRRIVLRFPEVAADLMPDDTPLRNPRRSVAATYARLASPAEAWLDQPLPGISPMPGAVAAVTERFGIGKQA